MNILVTGGSGQVGFELQRTLSPFGAILATGRQELDLADSQAIERYLEQHQPDCIVNAAAYTAVDRAESEPDLAHALNAGLPATLAQYAAAKNIWLVHYSSDYVYPGTGTAPWTEESETGPLSTYGQTKLAGDQAIQASGAKHLIFRTSWVYSARGNNFMKTMLRLGAEKETLNIVNDQHGSPTPARLIAQVTALALYRVFQADQPQQYQGIYHLAPRGTTHWHEFAQAIFEAAAGQGTQLKIRPENVHGIPTRDYPTPAARPLNSRMGLDKLEQTFSLQLPEWRGQLQQTLTEYLQTRQ